MKSSVPQINLTTKNSIPQRLDLSVVVPVYNEADSIPTLVQEIADALEPTQLNYEIICVDDGSVDGSTAILTEIARKKHDINLKGLILRRNYGQTPAMAAGFESALGEVIVTLDGDLQNDKLYFFGQLKNLQVLLLFP